MEGSISSPDDVLNLIRRRRSCRFFRKGEDMPEDDVKRILEAAMWAPSARNLQPLEYIMVRGERSREMLSQFARQSQPTDTPLSIVVIGDLKRAREVGDISPHDVTTHIKGLKMFIYMDAAAAIENMLLMAESLGYNTLWISSFDEDALEEFLKLPERFIPIAIICIGHKSRDIVVPPKRDITHRLHYEYWGPKPQDESHLGFSKKINEVF
jgi:nitroreductase